MTRSGVFSFYFRKHSLDTSMYRGYVSGTSYSYGRQFDMDEYHAADCTVRRIPRMPPRNHISPVVKCLLFSFNFLFWVSTTEPLWHFGLHDITTPCMYAPITPPPPAGNVKYLWLNEKRESIQLGKHGVSSLHNLTWACYHNEVDTDFTSQMKLTKLSAIHLSFSIITT